MEQELTSNYVSLLEMSEDRLKKIAKTLNLKVPPTLGKEKLVQAIKIKITKDQLQAEEEAAAQLRAEKRAKHGMKGHSDRKPSFEEVAIFGGVFDDEEYPPSKRVLVNFVNKDDPGQDLKFTKGGIPFHIFSQDKDENLLVSCMPEVLISKDKKFERISLVQRGKPVYKQVTTPDGMQTYSKLVGHTPRFQFIVLGEAPPDTPFGLYFAKDEQLEELSKGVA